MTLPYRSGLLAIFKFQFAEQLTGKKHLPLVTGALPLRSY